MQEISDDILIKAARGDIEAFEIVYRATARFVYNVACRVVRNAHDAEEITQEVFLTIYRKLKSFRSQSSLKTWIYRITVNSAINFGKKQSREKMKHEEYHKNINPWEAVSQPKNSGTNHKEAIELLLKILNPDQRMCVILRNLEGLSYQQIARAMKISINTVRSRLKRAREKLIAARKEVIKDGL
jgi:RNA polymerase sigma-70 factor, ECF subfamily